MGPSPSRGFQTDLAGLEALRRTKEKDDVVVKSANNLPKVATTALNNINVYDILKYDTVVVTSEAVAAIEEVYA